MGMRNVTAVTAGRLVWLGLHGVLRRNASQLPGRVTLSIDPDAIAHLRSKASRGSIVVCGTNGKTTTTNVIASALERQGLKVLCNRDGANMAAGVTSALLAGGNADWAVLEADELSTIRILPQLQPTYLVLLNLFRDQLDRAGELDHVQDVIASALASSPQTVLVVCADDPLSWAVARRAQRAGTKVFSFGIDDHLALPQDRVPEARFCQECGAELAYDYRTYAQLGKFACPSCDFARPQLDYAATNVRVDSAGVSFVASGAFTSLPVHASFGSTYLVYNLLAAWVAASLAGVDGSTFQQSLDDFQPHNGRLQRFSVESREVILNLAKNPTGLNQNITMLLADERPKAVFVVVNDDANDGRDVSWIWDVDFERLVSADIVRVFAGGHRAHDVHVRCKYAGIRAGMANSVGNALDQLSVVGISSEHPLYVLVNYSALTPTKAELEMLEEHYG